MGARVHRLPVRDRASHGQTGGRDLTTIADYNPVTYLLATLAVGVVLFFLAFSALRGRVSRG